MQPLSRIARHLRRRVDRAAVAAVALGLAVVLGLHLSGNLPPGGPPASQPSTTAHEQIATDQLLAMCGGYEQAGRGSCGQRLVGAHRMLDGGTLVFFAAFSHPEGRNVGEFSLVVTVSADGQITGIE